MSIFDETTTPEFIKTQPSNIGSIQHFSELTAGAGAQQLKVNKEGLSVGDTVIVDSEGLNSLNNFRIGDYYASDTIQTTSTSFVDVTGSSLSFTLSRSANVFIILSARIFVSGINTGAMVYINVDGSNVGPGLYEPASATSAASHIMVALGAGSHTIKLQWISADAGCTATMTERRLSYVILGI